MWPQAASCLLVFLSGLGISVAIPTSYGRFDPDRLTEDVYRLRGFVDTNPVDIAGLKAWNTMLEGFQKFAPVASGEEDLRFLADNFEEELPREDSHEENHRLDLKGFDDITKLFPPSQFESVKTDLKKETNKNEKKTTR